VSKQPNNKQSGQYKHWPCSVAATGLMVTLVSVVTQSYRSLRP